VLQAEGRLQMTAAISELLTWLIGGSAPAVLVKLLLAVSALALALVYRRYLGILGADRRRPVERQAYDALRASLAQGNIAARLYAQRLTRFLDWIDRFFGDAGMADRTLFPHAFGLRTPAPLWTAPAFDRCLLLAFIYPIATIILIWVVSGHVGQAESTLGLETSISGWKRASAAALISFPLLAMFFHCTERKGRLSRWAFRIGILAVLVTATSAVMAFVTWGFFIVIDLGLCAMLAIVSGVGAIAVATLVCWIGLRPAW
jgi:hypothetical protein